MAYKILNILNLYAGVGGNRKDWRNCKVTAIESEPGQAFTSELAIPDGIKHFISACFPVVSSGLNWLEFY